MLPLYFGALKRGHVHGDCSSATAMRRGLVRALGVARDDWRHPIEQITAGNPRQPNHSGMTGENLRLRSRRGQDAITAILAHRHRLTDRVAVIEVVALLLQGCLTWRFHCPFLSIPQRAQCARQSRSSRSKPAKATSAISEPRSAAMSSIPRPACSSRAFASRTDARTVSGEVLWDRVWRVLVTANRPGNRQRPCVRGPCG